MLLPALNKARESAKKVQCLSNLRQIGLAISTYVTQDGGYIPPYNINANGAANYPQGHAYWFQLLMDSNLLGTPDEYGQKFDRVFICPNADQVGALLPSSLQSMETYVRGYWGLINYGMNTSLYLNQTNWDGGPSIPTGVKISQVRHSSETVMVCEANNMVSPFQTAYYVSPYFDASAGVAWPFHGKTGCNILWVDGHASTAYRSVPDDPASLYSDKALGALYNKNFSIQPCYWDTN
jgi:prepilin-type processing-associated H-X9-DG protein